MQGEEAISHRETAPSGGDGWKAANCPETQVIEEHYQSTQSAVARKVLDHWEETLLSFVKVYPTDYRRVIEELKNKQDKQQVAWKFRNGRYID